ncbi:hypothetical protein Poli38472_009862 [Pythium oligandrum]|uniref:Uncharacterized protein n=1 Tax=Pythium oligandrum TaxID=41045 RepID=A0A8K1FIS2_PYTOL|nr:hypothetical protein Poli38472_009862 [Pythium oligandrum]|eukprot:TMW62369.1 hypothetical protein Poli38472_009862 [Pythium oligandrum]
MSDSDGLSMSETSVSESEEEKAKRKPPSLQKRRKPKQLRGGSTADDPFDDAAFKPSDTMAEEMNAMKQVFLRMSEKKVQQKEEKKAECKRLYKEAFRSDVEQIFKRANRTRIKTMEQVSHQIDSLKVELQASSDQLRSAHIAYKKKFDAELAHAESQTLELRSILKNIDAEYIKTKKGVDEEFEQVNAEMEESVQTFHTQLTDVWSDKSFIKVFRPQVDRLL